MRVSVIHNLKPGTAPISPRALRRLLKRHGHKLKAFAGKKDDWGPILENPGDLIVVAGGDGTVGKVARRCVRHAVPLAILPGGTANNICRTLGIQGNFEDLVAQWENAGVETLDLGLAVGPWGKTWFIEGFGVGLLATGMGRLHAQDKKSDLKTKDKSFKLIRDRLAFRGMVASFSPMRLAGETDGEPFDGDFLLIEAMNMRSVGPGFGLAPEADPADGLLDFCFIAAERREDFAGFIDSYAEDATPPTPARLLRGRRLRLKGHGHDSHIDDRIIPAETTPGGCLDIELSVDAAAVSMLAPGSGSASRQPAASVGEDTPPWSRLLADAL